MAQEFTSAYLVIQKGPLLGKRVEIWKERTTIGRSRDCDIFLEDITVHRKQASILRVATGYILRDDHGKGDSYINGQSVKEQQLNSGDQLLFGNTQLTFYANEGTRPFQLPSSRGRELLIGKAPDPHIARLDLQNAHSGVQSVELLPRMTIGRSRDCNIFLEDLAVSRHHATLHELSSGEYELTDNRSATGTFVNGQAIVRTQLHEGDHIQIGATQFTC
jgi:pSer/pThr/pTyr-binding forkhead associated (FHA) protein